MNTKIKRTKFNVSLLGESTVGKTSMIQKYLGNSIKASSLATIGIDNITDKVKFDGQDYIFKIYDTAGQEKYRSLTTSIIKVNEGFLLVFAVNNQNSYDRINYWINELADKVTLADKVIYLVGNKIDEHEPERVIDYKVAAKFAEDNDMKYFETSAKTGEGIKEVFKSLYEEVYNKNKSKIPTNVKLVQEPKKKGGGCCK
jgi:small GTP-binding protein